MSDAAHWLDRIAHDLRGPLTPLQTAAYLLKSGELDPQRQHELIDIIDRQTRRLARMIEEFDDWSRAQQQRLLGTREPFDLATTLDCAIGAVPDCMIEPDLAPDCVGLRVDCDQLRLIQAFKSLIQYVHQRDREATVQLSRQGDEVQVYLRDRGEALAPDAQAALLERRDPAPDDDGLGLRLLLARAIVEGHGGTLAIEPSPSGLVLRCSLPVATGDRS